MAAFIIKSRSIWICQTRSIQSGEKERADLSGPRRRGHLVLVCAERRRPRPLLKVNKLRRHSAAQTEVAESDFCSQMRRGRSDLIKNETIMMPIADHTACGVRSAKMFVYMPNINTQPVIIERMIWRERYAKRHLTSSGIARRGRDGPPQVAITRDGKN